MLSIVFPEAPEKIPFHREFADLGVEFFDGGGLARLF